MKCKALFMTKHPECEGGGALHAVDRCVHVAPVDRPASAVGRVGAAHIGDGSRVSASQCLDGRPLAVASRFEGREPGEQGRRRSHGGEDAAGKARSWVAAQRRARRQWRAASAALSRLQRDAVATAMWSATNSAYRAVAAAAAECRRLQGSGADWTAEVRRAVDASNVAERQWRGVS